MYQAVKNPWQFILYKDRIHAFLIPKSAVGEQEAKLSAYLKRKDAEGPLQTHIMESAMIIETYGPRETFALGKKMGEEAEAGTGNLPEWRLGSWKNGFYPGICRGTWH